MSEFSTLGKGLLALGFVLAAIGALFMFFGGFPWLGRLPGDIRVHREGFSFYFPLTTCLLLSAGVSLVLWLISKFK